MENPRHCLGKRGRYPLSAFLYATTSKDGIFQETKGSVPFNSPVRDPGRFGPAGNVRGTDLHCVEDA